MTLNAPHPQTPVARAQSSTSSAPAAARAFPPLDDGRVAGVGIDVAGIGRLAELIERTPALLERLFTPGERGLSDASRAARVAAKEAVGKALGSPGNYSWQDVTVERTDQHRPYLVLRGAALAAAERLGVTHLHLSLSHDGGIATAIVVAEREPAALGDGTEPRRDGRGGRDGPGSPCDGPASNGDQGAS